MDEWFSKGCEKCRQGVLSSRWPPPARIAAAADGWAFLHLCDECGAYWEFNVREAHVIDETEARQSYPAAFAGS